MKIWVDDMRPAPEGYVWCRSVNEIKDVIEKLESVKRSLIENNNRKLYMEFLYNPVLIDLDHDAGDYAVDGGDYIKLLDWLEETDYFPYEFHIHSMNPVGVENMRRIIQRNNWKEV
jgi:hypothetical protein